MMRAKQILKDQIKAFQEVVIAVRRHDKALEMIAEINERLAELRRMVTGARPPLPLVSIQAKRRRDKAKAVALEGVLNEAGLSRYHGRSQRPRINASKMHFGGQNSW